MISEYELKNEISKLKEMLSDYKDYLAEAMKSGNEKDIKHWKDNIEGLENRITGLEYELRNG